MTFIVDNFWWITTAISVLCLVVFLAGKKVAGKGLVVKELITVVLFSASPGVNIVILVLFIDMFIDAVRWNTTYLDFLWNEVPGFKRKN